MRIRVHWRWLVVVCAATAAAVQAADGDPSDKARRDQLSADRAAAQARYDQTVRECERSFTVTGCVNQAKAERRAELDRVAREQAALDDAERKRRAEERRQRIAKKQAQQAQQVQRAQQAQQSADPRAAASAPPLQVRTPRQASAAASAVAKPARRAEPRASQATAAAEAEAAERAAQAQQRRERAQAHEEAVRLRNAERAAQRAPAAPLPQASAAASAIR